MAISSGLGYQQEATDRSLSNLTGSMQPYLNAGQTAIGNLGSMSSGNFDFSTIQNNPMYQFTMDEATRNANRRLSPMGLVNSTYGAETLGRIGGGVAANALNDIYNRNLGIAGLGQNTAANYANSYGDLLTGMANARASGMLSQDMLDANRQADWMSLIGGLGGTVLGNWDTVSDIGSGLWDWGGNALGGLGDFTGWW